MTTNLIANIGIGNEVVRNDFDNLPIYREMIEELDEYGNVFIRIPKFYIKKEKADGVMSRFISKEKLEGYYLPKVFWDFENKRELPYFLFGKYNASLSADGTKLESKSGTSPLVNQSIVNFRNFAKANGKGYQQLDIHAVDVLQTLFYVEFATLNSQSIHPGFTSGNTEPLESGFSAGIKASSGALGTSGTNGFMYRGIENPWGNVYQFVDGVNINDHQAWVCRDARQYASNVFASPYEKLGYVNATENMWVTEMGYDSNNPFAEFPVSGGGGTTTYYADHYYQNAGQRIARFGGYWSAWSAAGLSCWSLAHSSAGAWSHVGGRLLKLPL